jgi:hypothetical protein
LSAGTIDFTFVRVAITASYLKEKRKGSPATNDNKDKSVLLNPGGANFPSTYC